MARPAKTEAQSSYSSERHDSLHYGNEGDFVFSEFSFAGSGNDSPPGGLELKRRLFPCSRARNTSTPTSLWRDEAGGSGGIKLGSIK